MLKATVNRPFANSQTSHAGHGLAAPQPFNDMLLLSTIETVELPLMLAGVAAADARRRAREALDLVGLAVQSHKRPIELTRGQQQRLVVASALVNEPAIDRETSAQAMELLCRLIKNRD